MVLSRGCGSMVEHLWHHRLAMSLRILRVRIPPASLVGIARCRPNGPRSIIPFGPGSSRVAIVSHTTAQGGFFALDGTGVTVCVGLPGKDLDPLLSPQARRFQRESSLTELVQSLVSELVAWIREQHLIAASELHLFGADRTCLEKIETCLHSVLPQWNVFLVANPLLASPESLDTVDWLLLRQRLDQVKQGGQLEVPDDCIGQMYA